MKTSQAFLGCPKFDGVMHALDDCVECGNLLQDTWIVCPYCGCEKSNIIASSVSITELARRASCTGCNKQCSSKKLKEKCCGKFKRKNKHCKKCPISPSNRAREEWKEYQMHMKVYE